MSGDLTSLFTNIFTNFRKQSRWGRVRERKTDSFGERIGGNTLDITHVEKRRSNKMYYKNSKQSQHIEVE